MKTYKTERFDPSATLQMECERKVIKYGSVSVEVILNGRNGLPIVLIPSWGRDSEEFGRLADLVARQGFRILRPVPRGAGASDGPVDGVTMYDLARDVVAVIEQEVGAPAIVAGHAFGSYLARAVSAIRPDLVCGVALLAAGHRRPAPADLVESVLKSGNMSLPAEERLVHLRRVFFAPGHDASIWLDGWNPKIGAASASAFKTPQSEYWQAGHAPILDVIAMQDPLRPPDTYNDIREDLGADRVTIVFVPDASHAVVMEQTERIASELIKFAHAVARKHM